MSIIQENDVEIKIKIPKKDVNKKMEVFYNPQMESNRNISVLVLNNISNKKMNIALPLAGSGIRALRFLKELKKGKINHILVNDKKDNFVKNFNENLKLNKLTDEKVSIFNEEASLFLLNRLYDKSNLDKCGGFFDYIELDPFGSPNPFLSAAIGRIARNGVLAVTATDTAALTGTYPKSAKRKYWAKITKNQMMHELGLRILIRKVQLLGMQFDKALIPILSYHKDHYFRIFFRNTKGKEKCDEILKQHKYFLYNPRSLEFEISNFNLKEGFEFIGPLWVGKLQNKKLLKKMLKENKFLKKLYDEKDLVGFHDLHLISKKYGVDTPKMEKILEELKATRTHFSLYGIKVNKGVKDVIKVMKNI